MRYVRTIFSLFFSLTVTIGMAVSSMDAATSLMEKGDSCRNTYRFNKALSYYQEAYEELPESNHADIRLQLLERIMRTHDVLRHWKELSETSYQLYVLAKKNDDKARESMALFMRGKRLFMEGNRPEGFRTCQEAVSQYLKTDDPEKNYELTIFYATLARMYGEAGDYAEAMRMSKEQERCVRLVSQADNSQDKRNFNRLYAIRVWLLAKMGRGAEADRLYRSRQIQPLTDPICGDALPEYYRIQRLDEEALRFIQMIKNNIRLDGDTVGRNMQRALDDEGDVYYRMGDYQKAAECYRGVTVLADSLSVRSLRNISKGVQQVMDSERAVSRHNLILAVVIAGGLLLLVVFFLVLRHDRIVNRKNRVMTQMVREMMHYRDIVIANGDPVETVEKSEEEVALNDEERRFKQMDKRVMKEELFRAPDFGRDELMRLMAVDKNAISVIISRYTGMNVTGYVNTRRMEYAVSLMKQHPEYTMSAIAEACGIKSQTTFIRNFKIVYGMTPSEFRQNLEELPPPNGQFENSF